MTTILELDAISVYRDDPRSGRRSVVRDLGLAVRRGERVFLVGPNGAGKTSLMLAVVGALPSDGALTVGGVALESATRARIRERTAFVFADPGDQLFCDTVFDEVAFGPRQRRLPEPRVRERVANSLASVGLTGFEQRSPAALSQGEQRRLAIATALSSGPDLVLLDEPTAALDPLARLAVLATLRNLDTTLIAATHDLDAALELDARVVLMKDGALVADGPARDLLSDEALLERAGLALPLSLSRAR